MCANTISLKEMAMLLRIRCRSKLIWLLAASGFDLQGFDGLLTQHQLHGQHGCEHNSHKMDPFLCHWALTTPMESIAGISHNSLLFFRSYAGCRRRRTDNL